MSNVTSMFSAEFSPPYGDGILVAGTYNVKMGFSSPYGDGTNKRNFFSPTIKLSSPYGDGTLNISQNIVKWKS